jgi:predicted MFS family arabinose efflux permease
MTRRLVFVGAAQVGVALQAMMLFPLGPDLVRSGCVSSADLGIVAGAYSAAVAVATFGVARILERVDRRAAFAACLAGVAVSAGLCALSSSLAMLVVTRLLAGAFAGPCSALAIVVVADLVPVARRGRAMAVLGSAIPIVWVAGMPAALWLAQLATWRLAFAATAILTAILAVATFGVLPALPPRSAAIARASVWRCSAFRWACVALACSTIGNFVVIPFISPYLQFNLGFPRHSLALLYLIGGLVSIAGVQVAGRLADTRGEHPTFAGGSVVLSMSLALGVLVDVLPAAAFYIALTGALTFRAVPLASLASKIPPPDERARAMAVQTSLQHAAQAVGATLGAALVGAPGDRALAGFGAAACVAITAAVLATIALARVHPGDAR